MCAPGPSEPFVPHTVTRRACGPHDVVIDVKFAGICHSDIHQVRNEWGPATFPMVPGHEVGGKVVAVGSEVTKFKVGDSAGVGCMVDSCRDCNNCGMGEEQYCTEGMVGTYNSKFKYAHHAEQGSNTYGGYSKGIVIDDKYCLKIPDNLDLAAATPLLCAGAAAGSLDFILCTVSADYEANSYLSLLNHDGKFIVVGAPSSDRPVSFFMVLLKRIQLGGSLIGGIRQTQEMLDFCGRKNIVCDIETIAADKIDEAYNKTVAGDVKYRFVIDCDTI
ncbi:chaperonin 10-like protein [Ochromonadaceae sp. CCMP2298]|nr:chaperonin 10-like protein [Ochromonadaceae sp. CCMP2298]